MEERERDVTAVRADDLFGRWLAHREQSTDPDRPVARTPRPAASATPTAPVTAPPAAPPTAPGTGPVPELDRVPPPDFDPVVLPSVRRKENAAGRGLRRSRTAPLAPVVEQPVLPPPAAHADLPPPPLEMPAEPLVPARPVRPVPPVVPSDAPGSPPPPVPDPPAPARVRRLPRLRRAPRPTAPGPAGDHHPSPDVAARSTEAVSGNHEFAPRTASRQVASLLLVLGLVATAAAAVVAYGDSSQVNIGIAASIALATAVIWAVRAGASTTHLAVRAGQLEVLRHGGRFVFDLTSVYTPIEVVGQPGHRGWQVLFLRRSMSPFVIDSSMVDPEEFMQVLRFHRPGSRV